MPHARQLLAVALRKLARSRRARGQRILARQACGRFTLHGGNGRNHVLHVGGRRCPEFDDDERSCRLDNAGALDSQYARSCSFHHREHTAFSPPRCGASACRFGAYLWHTGSRPPWLRLSPGSGCQAGEHGGRPGLPARPEGARSPHWQDLPRSVRHHGIGVLSPSGRVAYQRALRFFRATQPRLPCDL